MKIVPNYTSFGLSCQTSSSLRSLIESHLITDLKFYGIDQPNLKFDWSDSCIEGHDTDYLGSSLENYSGIKVFDHGDNVIVTYGWMEFIHEGDFFLVYWDLIESFDKAHQKLEFGMPEHVWNQIPDEIKSKYWDERGE